MITITKTITQPIEVIEAFADSLGYQSVVANPAYSVTIDEETREFTSNGEPQTIANSQTKLEYVSERFDAMASKWFAQFSERNARQEAENTIKATVEATEQAIKASISTII